MTEIEQNTLEPQTEQDYLALSQEFNELHRLVLYSTELEKKLKDGVTISAEDQALLASMPAKMRRAVDITRVLRRTNTGPAKVKEKKTSKKALAQKEIDDLLNM